MDEHLGLLSKCYIYEDKGKLSFNIFPPIRECGAARGFVLPVVEYLSNKLPGQDFFDQMETLKGFLWKIRIT